MARPITWSAAASRPRQAAAPPASKPAFATPSDDLRRPGVPGPAPCNLHATPPPPAGALRLVLHRGRVLVPTVQSMSNRNGPHARAHSMDDRPGAGTKSARYSRAEYAKVLALQEEVARADADYQRLRAAYLDIVQN